MLLSCRGAGLARLTAMTSAHNGPRVRPAIASIPAYVPGRPPAPRPGVPTYKLSSNENPYPPLPGVLEAATAAAATMNRYPDMGCTALYAALGEHLDVPTDNLAAGAGSVAVLYHLLQAYCEAGDEVVYAWRSFEAYPIAVAVTGATSVQVPLGPEARHDLDAMAEAITDRTKVVIVCTPEQPHRPGRGPRGARGVPGPGAAARGRGRRRGLPRVRPDRRPGGRGRALPGPAQPRGDADLREGLRPRRLPGRVPGRAQPIASAVRACSLPFGVSAVAQAAAVASLEREADLLERVDALVAERERVVTALREQGWSVPDAQGNFVWLSLGDRTGEFAAAAEEAGVMVRPFAGEGARVSIGDPAGNDVFLKVAAGFAG